MIRLLILWALKKSAVTPCRPVSGAGPLSEKSRPVVLAGAKGAGERDAAVRGRCGGEASGVQPADVRGRRGGARDGGRTGGASSQGRRLTEGIDFVVRGFTEAFQKRASACFGPQGAH